MAEVPLPFIDFVARYYGVKEGNVVCMPNAEGVLHFLPGVFSLGPIRSPKTMFQESSGNDVEHVWKKREQPFLSALP